MGLLRTNTTRPTALSHYGRYTEVHMVVVGQQQMPNNGLSANNDRLTCCNSLGKQQA